MCLHDKRKKNSLSRASECSDVVISRQHRTACIAQHRAVRTGTRWPRRKLFEQYMCILIFDGGGEGEEKDLEKISFSRSCTS